MRNHPGQRMGYNQRNPRYETKSKSYYDWGHKQPTKGYNKGKGKGKGKSGKDDKKYKQHWNEKRGSGKGAATLRNGEPVCVAWNEGKCTNNDDSCPNGKHVCNAVVGKDKRVCGMRNHRRSECTKVRS